MLDPSPLLDDPSVLLDDELLDPSPLSLLAPSSLPDDPDDELLEDPSPLLDPSGEDPEDEPSDALLLSVVLSD